MKIALFILGLLGQFSAHAIVFGSNNILEVQPGSNRASTLGNSVALMVSDTFILPSGQSGTSNLDLILASAPGNIGLCKEEKFSNQYTAWVNCSGFLIADDLLVTAGHCVTFKMEVLHNETNANCQFFRWVFDFRSDANGQFNPQNFSNENIYSCKRIVHAEHLAFNADHHGTLMPPAMGTHGTDFAIVQLDRPVTGRKPLKLASKVPSVGSSVITVGHPMALPLKWSANAYVLKNYDDYLLTDLDIVGGNSGGPVINLANEVVGIAVRSFPYEDFVYHRDRNCSTLATCKKIGEGDCLPSRANEVLGTHADKIEHVKKWLEKEKL
jgi:V8-like Glu-specific endopeptidase